MAITRLLPFLVYGSERAITSLLAYFAPHLDWTAVDGALSHAGASAHAGRAAEPAVPAASASASSAAGASMAAAAGSLESRTFFQDCFVLVLNAIPPTRNGSVLRQRLRTDGVLDRLVAYVLSHRPAEGAPPEAWRLFLDRPVLPQVLRALLALVRGHLPTQEDLASRAGVIACLHQLEQLTSERHVGTLSEMVLDAMAADGAAPAAAAAVAAARSATRQRRQALALAQRAAVLQDLGFAVEDPSGGGRIKATRRLTGMEDLEDADTDAGVLVCVVCREGYRYKPAEPLGIYTFSKGITLDAGTARGEPTYEAKLEWVLDGGRGGGGEGLERAVVRAGMRRHPPSPRTDMSTRGEGRDDRPARLRLCAFLAVAAQTHRGYLTVTHFNAIHISCHEQAARADRNRPGSRDVWDGATLRNSDTLCNNLLPMLVRAGCRTKVWMTRRPTHRSRKDCGRRSAAGRAHGHRDRVSKKRGTRRWRSNT